MRTVSDAMQPQRRKYDKNVYDNRLKIITYLYLKPEALNSLRIKRNLYVKRRNNGKCLFVEKLY